MVAINGVPFDPNPPLFSRFYNRVEERVRQAVSWIPRPVSVDRLVSKVQIKGIVTQVLSRIRKKRKRNWGHLGKVRSFAVQEVNLSQMDVLERNENQAEDKEIMETGSNPF